MENIIKTTTRKGTEARQMWFKNRSDGNRKVKRIRQGNKKITKWALKQSCNNFFLRFRGRSQGN
jgi:hypothetical protein